jgi:hypothetical protein
MLAKPKMGEACNGCGLCCRLEVCGMGLEAMGDNTPAPCPALIERDGRTWCQIIQIAEESEPCFAEHLKWRLGIGAGCQVHDDYAEGR